MALAITLVVAALAVAVAIVWAGAGEDPAPPVGAAPLRLAAPESIEGALVAQLVTGRITRRQYVRSMEGVAAREEKRHPLAVPPEPDPAG